MNSVPLNEIESMNQKLIGTLQSFSNNIGSIKADNGDWYDFRSKREFKIGDIVEFEPVDSHLAFELAMLGGPIPCKKVKRIE